MKKSTIALLCSIGLSTLATCAIAETPAPTPSDGGVIHLADWWWRPNGGSWCANHPDRCHREWCHYHPGACGEPWCARHPVACRERWCYHHPWECNR